MLFMTLHVNFPDSEIFSNPPCKGLIDKRYFEGAVPT